MLGVVLRYYRKNRVLFERGTGFWPVGLRHGADPNPRFYNRGQNRGHNLPNLTAPSIIQGLVNSVAGVLYLPNHWTSLVITFNPPKILYGDSLGNSMPPIQASSFQRWICHMLSRSGKEIPESDISIYPLATTIQQDFNSCGLFALNAIEHHYLQDSPLLQCDVLSVAYSRIQIALGILQENTVSIPGKEVLS